MYIGTVNCFECRGDGELDGQDCIHCNGSGECDCRDCNDAHDEAAYERQCEDFHGGSGPLTLDEQHRAAWQQKQELRR
jgi:hypothetical protein